MTRTRNNTVRRAIDPIKAFLDAETGGGLILLAATVVALGWANSPFAGAYAALWGLELTVGTGPVSVTNDLQHWVNEGLMVLFFFVIGLEVKRELVAGDLRDPRRASLPVVAALGGAAVPVGIFLALNAGSPGAHGWGIPMATDIAFAVGVLAVLGSRMPAAAKLFLLTLAIVDDVLAVLVIALFYTGDLAVGWAAVALAGLGLILLLRRAGVRWIAVYVPIGVLVWLATLESGVHATIAGVALGLATPARPVGGRHVLEQLEQRLHPISSYLVIPLFALANAGVPLGAAALAAAAGSPIAWGVALGLLVGKTVGVGAVVLGGIRLGLGALPEGMTSRHVAGIGALAGIGFTMSLFIAELAYADGGLTDVAKVGILAGSAVSGLVGVILLTAADRARRRTVTACRHHVGGVPR